MSTNWIDPTLSSDLKVKAEIIIKELELEKAYLRVRCNDKHMTFTQDRRVVEVPLSLINRGQWSDIRYLFRAVLNSAPAVWNRTADDNDWSAYKSHSYKGDE